jgi:hypothetical protein
MVTPSDENAIACDANQGGVQIPTLDIALITLTEQNKSSQCQPIACVSFERRSTTAVII